jgi:signal transduction histidine kinase/ActR/RegA family two-component response regulator
MATSRAGSDPARRRADAEGSLQLGTKTLVGLGASFALWCSLLYWANASLVRPSFEALEVRTVERNCDRVTRAIGNEATTLSSKAGDWSLWDETYDFILDRNEDFVKANLNEAALETLAVDVMAFVGLDGKIVHLTARDAELAAAFPADAIGALLAREPDLLQHDSFESSHHGLTTLQDRLAWVASRPIHRSDHGGERRGSLLFVRLLDAAMIAVIGELTETSLAISAEPSPGPTAAIVRSEEEIEGRLGLADMFGRPLASCTVRMQREIHQEGEAALRLLMVALMVSSGLALLTTLAGFHTVVMRRLHRLHGKIREITKSGDLSQRVAVQGCDEIADLASSFNDLTRTLQTTQQNLIRANEVRSQFLANVSHEVRTPVTALLGFAELLLDPHLPRGQHDDFVRTVRRNAQHLLAILNDLLDSAKIESGQMSVERLPVPFAELLFEVVDLSIAAAARKGVDLRAELAGPVPATIVTDPIRLRQILMNLVGNAVKFTSEGSIRLVVSMAGESTVRIDVVDTGIGITEAQKARLFQPFAQADASTSRRFGGTGLGLALSRNLARLLGGDITVDSLPGVGSTFRVELDTGDIAGVPRLERLHRALRPASAASASEPQVLAEHRLLVVEDSADNRRLVSFVLRKAGATVDVAENGRIAVDLLLDAMAGGAPYDLVVMDMQMPVLDGYAATAELRGRGIDVPILALTASAMQADQDACLQAGCTAFATKPIDRVALVARVAALLPASAPSTAGEKAVPLQANGTPAPH